MISSPIPNKLTCLVYVTAVWNTYRMTHLMVLDIIIRCIKIVHADSAPTQEQKKADELVKYILASIPYHLSADPKDYLQAILSGSGLIKAGRPVGGLLLLHPLFVGARLSILSVETRNYMNRCLAWMGENMGIGQATLLSNVRLRVKIDLEESADKVSSPRLRHRFSILQKVIFLSGQECLSGP